MLEELDLLDDYDMYQPHYPSKQIGGNHYQKDVQPWDAMQAWMTHEAFCGYLRGNVIKYVARYKEKNGLEDLEKALHYLDRLIQEET